MSPQRCLVCAHEQRQEIDRRLVGGSPPNYSSLARTFGIDHEAISRHHRAHLPALLVKAAAVEELASADWIARRINAGLAELDGVVTRCKLKGDERGIVAAVKAQASLINCVASTAAIMDDMRNRPVEVPPQRAAHLADIEILMARKIDAEVTARLAATPSAPPPNPRPPPSTQRSGVRAPGVDGLPGNPPAELPEAAGQ